MSQVEVVVHHSRDPLSIAVQNKTVDTAFFISRNTYLLHQVFAMSNSRKGCQPPAVAAGALLDVCAGEAINCELRVLEDPWDAMNRTGSRLSATIVLAIGCAPLHIVYSGIKPMVSQHAAVLARVVRLLDSTRIDLRFDRRYIVIAVTIGTVFSDKSIQAIIMV
ncbi:hypothetical protein HG530_011278 [Fusarium avenaceum]|nr:hypothetical protein HG530_011278 [Fusarium avenaceum]